MSKIWHGRRPGFIAYYFRNLVGSLSATGDNVIDNNDDDVIDAYGNVVVVP